MTAPVRIPADVDREDRLIGDLTARQLAILATAGAALYAVWVLCFRALPMWSPAWASSAPVLRGLVFAAAAVPIAVAGLALALGRRDGMPLDRLLITAARQRLATPTLRPPRNRAPGSEGDSGFGSGFDSGTESGFDEDTVFDTGRAWVASRAGRRRRRRAAGRVVVPWVSARTVRASRVSPAIGLVELGRAGLALVCAVTPISLTLRSPAEQDQLVAGMARWLHSLTHGVQILVRTTPLDLSAHIGELRGGADWLPHPALQAAAHGHADYLADLAQHTELLQRRIYLVFRQPIPSTGADHDHGATSGHASGRGRAGRAVRAVEEQLLRRAEEANHLLGAIGLRITPLDPPTTAHTLHAATNPDQHINPRPPTPSPPAPRPRQTWRSASAAWSESPTTAAVAHGAWHPGSAHFGIGRLEGDDFDGDGFDTDENTSDLYALADLDRYNPNHYDPELHNLEHYGWDDEQVEHHNLRAADPPRQTTSAGLRGAGEAREGQPWGWVPGKRGSRR